MSEQASPKTMTIGSRIKAKRIAYGWSQQQLAAHAGVSQQLIAKLETGEVRETRKVAKIARALGMSADALLSMDEMKAPPSSNFGQYLREMAVVHMYADLPEDVRRHVRRIIEALAGASPRGEDNAEKEVSEEKHQETVPTNLFESDGHAGGLGRWVYYPSGIDKDSCRRGEEAGQDSPETAAEDYKEVVGTKSICGSLDSGSTATEILAANVRALIARVGSGAELARLTGVPQKTISRALNDENAVNLDTLNYLAEGMRLQPWQLLVPNLDLSNLPLLFQPDQSMRGKGRVV